MSEETRITLTLNSSQLAEYIRCPRRWFYGSPLGKNIEIKDRDVKAMSRGTFIHGLLERYYTKIWEGDSWVSAQAYATSKLAEVKKLVELPVEDYTFLFNRFVQYCVRYSDDKIRIGTIERNGAKNAAVEVGFSFPLLDNSDYLFVIEGRIDMIVQQSGVDVIWDHKIQTQRKEIYGRSVQLSNYTLATEISRGMHNYVRLAQTPNGDTFERKVHFFGPLVKERWRKYILGKFFEIASLQNEPRQELGACEGEHWHPCMYIPLCEQTDDLITVSKIAIEYQIKKPYRSWTEKEIL